MGLRLLRATFLALFVVTVAASVAVPMVWWDVPATTAVGMGLLTVIGGSLGFLFALVDYALDEAEPPPGR